MTVLLLTLDKLLALFLRAVLGGRVSRKRISQEYFRRLAEKYAADGVQHWSPISGSKEEAIQFLRADTRVVIVGGSDYTFYDRAVFESFPNITWFVQNLNVEASIKIRPLPIGVEGLQWGRAGLPWHFLPKYRSRPKLYSCLVGPFRITHPARTHLLELAASRSLTVISGQLASFHYSYLASTYRWVACPEGNGVDTHRFWETLQRGSIPVVLRNAWSKNFEAMEIPMLQIESWELLDQVIATSATKINPQTQLRRLRILEQDYWEDTLVSILNS